MTATELSRNLSALLGEIRFRRIDLEVTKGDQVIARVVPPDPAPTGCPIDRLDDLFRRLPMLGRQEADAFAADVHAVRRVLTESGTAWDS